MYIYHGKIDTLDLGAGVVQHDFAQEEKMNVLHWNMSDKSEVKLYTHSQEQFGYVIKGGFEMLIGEERTILQAGDAYVVPPNVPHAFVAIGETEAIDVFSPVKTDFPWKD